MPQFIMIQLKCELDNWDWDNVDLIHRNLTSIDKLMNDLANETATSPTPQLIQPFHGEIKLRFHIHRCS